MQRLCVGLSALIVACSTPPPSPQGQVKEPPASAVVSPPATPANDAERARGPVVQVASRGASVLELPTEQAFVTAPLPVLRPDRYDGFVQTSRIVAGRGYLYVVDLFPGEAWLLSMSDDEATVRVYERQTSRLVGNYPVRGFQRFGTGGVLAWPEGEPRFVVASTDGLFLYDAKTGAVLETLSPLRLDGVRWSPDRRVLVAREAREPKKPGRLHFFARTAAERKSGEPSLGSLGAIDLPERIDAWDLSADNRLLATAGYPSGELVVTDLKSGATVVHVPGPDYGGDVAFSPDGRFVAMGGQGLLMVDLLNPARLAYYSKFDNNIGHVRFSPSGDAVAASSYDGKIRIFNWEFAPRGGQTALTLTLAQTLRHEGQANVYAFVFEANGDGIVSASGDRTIRTFRGPKPVTSGVPRQQPTRTFLALAEWARLDPDGARPLPPPPEPSMRDGHYHPPALDGAPRPAAIRPGRYACKIDLMYKLRDCRVWKDDRGHTRLEFAEGNLLELEGVLYDDGPVVRYEAWQRAKSIVGNCRGCEQQPLQAVFRGAGGRYKGVLTFRNYHDPYTPPEPPAADAKSEASDDRFPVVLEFRGAP